MLRFVEGPRLRFGSLPARVARMPPLVRKRYGNRCDRELVEFGRTKVAHADFSGSGASMLRPPSGQRDVGIDCLMLEILTSI
jgi:hypothetical protein